MAVVVQHYCENLNHMIKEVERAIADVPEAYRSIFRPWVKKLETKIESVRDGCLCGRWSDDGDCDDGAD